MGLLQLSLHTEELGAVATGFLLGILQLGLEIVHLRLPFRDRLVESALLLLQIVGVSVGLRVYRYRELGLFPGFGVVFVLFVFCVFVSRHEG